MAKALKPLVVILLLLSIAALVLGAMLFGKRETLKGRTQKLEQAVEGLAAQLAAPREPYVEGLEPARLDAQKLMDYASMDVPLARLKVLAANRYDQLFQTHDDLKVMTDRLEATNRVLLATQNELADTKDELAQTQDELTERTAELARANESIGALEQEKDLLQVQIDDLNTQLTEAQEASRDLEDQIVTLTQDIAELERRLGIGQKATMEEGLAGRILVVSPEWNFVVLNIGSEDGVVAAAEMLVHRADQLIGKVRISEVTDQYAIADIVTDWEKAPPREGDHVFF